MCKSTYAVYLNIGRPFVLNTRIGYDYSPFSILFVGLVCLYLVSGPGVDWMEMVSELNNECYFINDQFHFRIILYRI